MIGDKRLIVDFVSKEENEGGRIASHGETSTERWFLIEIQDSPVETMAFLLLELQKTFRVDRQPTSRR